MGTVQGGALVNFLADVVRWFSDPANWQGSTGVPTRVLQHLNLSVWPVLLAAIVAVPLGVQLGHRRRGAFLAISLANIGRAVPSFAVLVIGIPIAVYYKLGTFYWPAFLALLLLAIPPMLTNAYTGVREVAPGIVESSRGMGLTERQVLRKIEIPMALPVIITGVRVSAVQVVATATLAALIGGGGLGRYIIDGLSVRDFVEVFAGALLVAALSIATEGVFSLVERLTVSPGITGRTKMVDTLNIRKAGLGV
jgi:osmoprotectant transport system permease protein